MYIARLSAIDGGDDQAASRVSSDLVACGPRAAPFIVSALADYSPFERGYGFLPRALADLGEAGHSTLLESLKAEGRPNSRAYLNYVLMYSFNDYSMFDDVLGGFTKGAMGKMVTLRYEKYFRDRFDDAPGFLEQGKINEKFVVWWNEKGHVASKQGKTLVR